MSASWVVYCIGRTEQSVLTSKREYFFRYFPKMLVEHVFFGLCLDLVRVRVKSSDYDLVFAFALLTNNLLDCVCSV